MTRLTTSYERLAWEDRYNEPTPEQLREGLSKESCKLFDAMRSNLCEIEDITESTAWRGECWRWTIEYRLSQQDALLAVLIPSPEDLQVAVPVSPDLTDALPARPLKRAVREGLELGLEPFDTHWGVWSISYPNLVGELFQLIEIQYGIVTGTKRRRKRN